MEEVGKKFKIKAFGITKEILGAREKIVEVKGQTVADLRNELLKKYPGLASLKSLMIAINNIYAEDSQVLQDADEIALIPPVSGG
jgi:molybdopterin converting factor subunit 1